MIPTYLSQKKEFRELTLAQMLSGRQQVIGNVNSFNVLTSYNNIVNINAGLDAERQQILQWLSSLEPQQRHEGCKLTDSIAWETGY